MAFAVEGHTFRNRNRNRRRIKKRRFFVMLSAVAIILSLGLLASKSVSWPFLSQSRVSLEDSLNNGSTIYPSIGLNDKFEVHFAHLNGSGSGKGTSSKPSHDGGQGSHQGQAGGSTQQPGQSGTAGTSIEGNSSASQSGSGTSVTEKKEKKYIALTFDDGPDTKYTTAILDILKEKGVKATFFVVGTQISKYPEVLQRIVDEGHAVGSHSQSHADLSKKNKNQIIKDVDSVDQLFENTLGYTPELFRAPYGAVSDTLKAVLKDKERHLIGWNIDTRDWAGTSPKDMRAMIKKEAKDGSIVLMHSFGGKHIANTVEALPSIIDDLLNNGFTPVTINEMP